MAITLNNGFKMPIIGLGVWRMDESNIRDLIINAIKIGYRHIDCAADYRNEAEVGEALAEAFSTGLVKREDLFITTKLWNSDHGHVLEACKDSLKKLQLDYLDLYLVHFPVATKHTGVGTTDSALDADGVLEIDTTISLETTWHAMEDLVSMGLVRSIGIRLNFVCVHCLVYIIPAFLFKLSFPLAVIVEKTLDQWQVDTSLKLMRGSQFFCLVEFNSGS
ncbi:hypothetical protein CISIN_1g021693mg [Citrus sinensis]|uniref:NADP-dependent oxidoreductase domain-containing protein n=1 Tax=Citrus sinensis TaxID=2711 RepID=A0A067DHI4_CITSI|nr:hypothetical protein CISIN_1g021693mg [Citrus sinensis]